MRNALMLTFLVRANKTLFLFNNVDSFVCKKLGYFVFEAFQQRKERL